MKLFRLASVALVCGALLLSSCGSMTNTGKGALIGGAATGAAGAGIGALIGGGQGAAIGAAIGTAVGAGAGALIGKKMDKQQAELAAQLAQDAAIEKTTDANGLQAIKVTFEGGILFPTGKSTINKTAQASLTKFAQSVVANPGTNVAVYGFTDNTGSMTANEKVATDRAAAVLSFLCNQGVAPTRITSEGIPMADYVASNDTPEGRAQNRRVEIYITAGEDMIQQANDGTLK